jgi:hypothetical protein
LPKERLLLELPPNEELLEWLLDGLNERLGEVELRSLLERLPMPKPLVGRFDEPEFVTVVLVELSRVPNP